MSSTGEAQAIDYDAFGNVIHNTNPGFQPFGFAGGHYYDPDTRLVRFGARDYDALTGRWLATDPLRFRGASNFYAYAANDPIDAYDPDGRYVRYLDPGLGIRPVNCVRTVSLQPA